MHRWRYIFLIILLLSGCSTSSVPGPDLVTVSGDSQAELQIGMSLDEVEDRWGETDCIFRDVIQGHGVDAWGYGLDGATGEVTGIPDCENARVILYFASERLAAWSEVEQ